MVRYVKERTVLCHKKKKDTLSHENVWAEPRRGVGLRRRGVSRREAGSTNVGGGGRVFGFPKRWRSDVWRDSKGDRTKSSERGDKGHREF